MVKVRHFTWVRGGLFQGPRRTSGSIERIVERPGDGEQVASGEPGWRHGAQSSSGVRCGRRGGLSGNTTLNISVSRNLVSERDRIRTAVLP